MNCPGRPEGPSARGLRAALAVALSLAGAGCRSPAGIETPNAPALRVLAMDPLAAELACACVEGYAQRDYGALARFLERRLRRSVAVRFAAAMAADDPDSGPPDIVIGTWHSILHDAREAGLDLRPEALLTDLRGRVTVNGLFVVRQEAAVQRLEDLDGATLLIGPPHSQERHDAALATLEAHGVRARTSGTQACATAALAVSEGGADAAVISSYAWPLLIGCGTLDEGELRVIAETGAAPFVGVFLGAALAPELRDDLLAALDAVAGNRRLRRLLESRNGFVRCADPDGNWTDWRGAERAGRIAAPPFTPPRRLLPLWSRPLTGIGMAGLSLADGRLFVADKDLDEEHDVWRCLDADTGVELWRFTTPAPGTMDFSNSPRAQPVVSDGRVVALGAFGDLACLDAETGTVLWRRNLLRDFRADLPTWGTCGTPLVHAGRVIVSPGAPDASLAAFDLVSGDLLWTSPGEPAGYGSLIVGRFGGVEQAVGHDAVSLGGWDPATGRRLWRLDPQFDGDFNVPTPIDLGDGTLLACTENNGARRYGFGPDGRILPDPLAVNEEWNSDTATAVLTAGGVVGLGSALICLDPRTLEPRWRKDGPPFTEHCALLDGGGYAAAVGVDGQVVWFRTDGRYRELLRLSPLGEAVRDAWSHPVLTGRRLYLRDPLGVHAFLALP